MTKTTKQYLASKRDFVSKTQPGNFTIPENVSLSDCLHSLLYTHYVKNLLLAVTVDGRIE